MDTSRVLVSSHERRLFLCNLANLDLGFVAAGMEEAGLEPIYRGAGVASLPSRPWLRIGHQSADSDVLQKIAREIRKSDKAPTVQRFIDKYSGLIPADPQSDSVKHDVLFWLLELQAKLIQVWIHSDQRAKQYGVFWILEQLTPSRLRTFHAEKNFLLIPAETPFERALFQLITDWDLAKVCGNPDCRKACFFAARSSQKYCSIECGKPALRQAKRSWWKRERGTNK